MSTLIDRHLKIPQYLQLAEHLREQIESGQLQPGDRLPSFNEMKAQFDAVQRTVEKAHALLEGDGLIRREAGRGVFVNQPATQTKTGNVGFVLPHNMQPERDMTYWGLALSGIRQAARDRNYHLLLIDEDDSFNRWDKMDGVVLCDTRDPRNLERAMPRPPVNFPAVSIFNKIPGTACITTDDADGFYQLTRHLIELGHTRIAYLATITKGIHQLEVRREGYLRALREAGIEPDPHWQCDIRKRPEWNGLMSWYPLAGEYYVNQWLETGWNELGCTALIAQNDAVAKGAMNAFQAAGIKVPEDISIAGFDGLPLYSDTLTLTTAKAPLFEMGLQAMNSLLDWLKDSSNAPQDIQLPVELIQGNTTAAPATQKQEKLLPI